MNHDLDTLDDKEYMLRLEKYYYRNQDQLDEEFQIHCSLNGLDFNSDELFWEYIEDCLISGIYLPHLFLVK